MLSNIQLIEFLNFKGSPLMLTITSKGYVVNVAQNFVKETGYDLNDFSGKSIHAYMFPEDREKLEKAIQMVFSSTSSQEFSTRFFTKNQILKTFKWKLLKIGEFIGVEMKEIDFISFFTKSANTNRQNSKTEKFTENKLNCQEPERKEVSGSVALGSLFEQVCENNHILIEKIENGETSFYSDRNSWIEIFECLIQNFNSFYNDNLKVSCNIHKKDNLISFSIEDNNQGIIHCRDHSNFMVFSEFPNENFMGNQKEIVRVKELVKQMKGKFWISAHINGGNTYYFEIPIL